MQLLSLAFSALQLRETHSTALAACYVAGADHGGSLHRSRHGTTNQTIEPVVIAAFGAELPFVDGATATGCLDAILGGQVFGEQSVFVGIATE